MDEGEAGEVGKARGRGRPRLPDVPVPPWPSQTGPLVMGRDAFKRGGEVVEVEVGRLPGRPETFIYGRR